MKKALPGRPTASSGKIAPWSGGGKQSEKAKGKRPVTPPRQKLTATAKSGAKSGAKSKGHGKGWEFEDFEMYQPAHPSFYGAASRRRALELSGQATQPDAVRAWGLNRSVNLPPAPPKGATKNKPKKAEPAEPEPIPEPDVAPLMRVEVGDDMPPVSEGFHVEAPVVTWSKKLQASGLLGSASTILGELVEDVAAEVELKDDPEWEIYPQLGEIIKDNGGEESSLCVAVCNTNQIWGVGVAGKSKNRNAVAKLALCVALASQATQDFASKWIEFMDFALTGAIPEANSTNGAEQSESWEAPASKKKKRGRGDEGNEEDAGSATKKSAPWAGDKPTLPRDEPLFITLEDTRPDKLADCSSDMALVVSTGGATKKGLYSQSEAALRALFPDGTLESSVEYLDDPNWSEFPTIGKALKAIAEEEECFTVAVCPSADVWAVGVGMKSKSRSAAAKAALATSLILQKIEAEDDLPEEFEELTQFAEFVELAKEAKSLEA